MISVAMLHAYGVLFLMKEGLVRRMYLLKILVAILLVAGLLTPSTATALSSTTVKLWIGNASMLVNGVQQPIDAQGTEPVIVADTTLVPVRAVIEALGGSIVWNASARSVDAILGDCSVSAGIGGNVAYANGKAVAIDPANPKVVPLIISGRTMLPLRFVTENFGCSVVWVAATKTITYTP